MTPVTQLFEHYINTESVMDNPPQRKEDTHRRRILQPEEAIRRFLGFTDQCPVRTPPEQIPIHQNDESVESACAMVSLKRKT